MRRSETRSANSPDDLPLFDLPLVIDSGAACSEEPASETAEPEAVATEPPEPEGHEHDDKPTNHPPGLIRRRFLAGLFDLAVQTSAFAVLLLAALFSGAGLQLSDWPGYLLAMTSFSFMYTVFSLIFWSRTPGMARARLVARSGVSASISTGQAVLRWLGGLATFALLGLPTLLALRGEGSLTDQLSHTRVGS